MFILAQSKVLSMIVITAPFFFLWGSGFKPRTLHMLYIVLTNKVKLTRTLQNVYVNTDWIYLNAEVPSVAFKSPYDLCNKENEYETENLDQQITRVSLSSYLWN